MRIHGPALLSRTRRLLAAIPLLVGSCVVMSAFGPASAAGDTPMLVTVDQATVIRLSAPANTIVVGNPAIADATIVDASTLVITGRSFGTTNLIVLDAAGNVLTDELVTVQAATGQVVVYRRSLRQTYSCTPVCAPTLNVGDGDPAFQTTTEQILARQAIAGGP